MTDVHKVTVTIDGTPDLVLPVISGTLTLDETQSPRINATLICPATAAVLALDPQRDIVMATITATVATRIDLIRDISRRVAGMTLSGLSALFTGLDLSEVIPEGLSPTSTATWRVQLRSVRERWAADTVSLRFKSIEQILIDHRQPYPFDPGPPGHPTQTVLTGPTIIASVNQILTALSLPVITVYDAAASGAASADSRAWPRGVSAWEKIQELIRGVDLLLWADNTGALQLQKSSWTAASVTLSSFGAARTIVDGGQFIDRDDPDFATAVDNLYRDPSGVDWGQTWVYEPYPLPHAVKPYRTLFRRVAEQGLTYGTVTAQQAKMAFFRGRGWSVKAISDYSIAPAQVIEVTRPSLTIDGITRSVQFSWPEDEMTVDVREAIPAGFHSSPAT